MMFPIIESAASSEKFLSGEWIQKREGDVQTVLKGIALGHEIGMQHGLDPLTGIARYGRSHVVFCDPRRDRAVRLRLHLQGAAGDPPAEKALQQRVDHNERRGGRHGDRHQLVPDDIVLPDLAADEHGEHAGVP